MLRDILQESPSRRGVSDLRCPVLEPISRACDGRSRRIVVAGRVERLGEVEAHHRLTLDDAVTLLEQVHRLHRACECLYGKAPREAYFNEDIEAQTTEIRR